MNRIKIINQVLLGLLFVFMSLLIAFQNALFENIYIICFLTKRDALSLSLTAGFLLSKNMYTDVLY